MPNSRAIQQEIRKIQRALTPDLRAHGWESKPASSPVAGHCYVACEVLYHRQGGKAAGWTPRFLNHETFSNGLAEGETHWFLQHASGLIADPTAAQFGDAEIPYDQGRGAGFLTREPSHRARIVMDRITATEKAPQHAA